MTGSQVASAREAYLARLDVAARHGGGPAHRTGQRGARAQGPALLGGPGDEAALRTVLDALGAPREIARAAVEQEPGAALHPGSAQTGPQAASLRDARLGAAADVRRLPHRHRLGGRSRAAVDVATMAHARQVARDVGLAVRLRRGGLCRCARWHDLDVDDLLHVVLGGAGRCRCARDLHHQRLQPARLAWNPGPRRVAGGPDPRRRPPPPYPTHPDRQLTTLGRQKSATRGLHACCRSASPT